MSKKLKWPLAKVREDGTPAVWMGWRQWHVLRSPLVRAYCEARQRQGESRARKELNKADEILDHAFGTCAMGWDVDDAMELYTILADAHMKPSDRENYRHLSPADLKELGDVHEKRGCEDRKKRIQEETDRLKEAA